MVKDDRWQLVGPWYRWGSAQEDPGRARLSRPIIQKYSDSNHVESFLDNPQRSLRFLPEDRSENDRRKLFLDTHSRFYLVVCALHCDSPDFPKVKRDKACEAGFVVRRRRVDVPDEIRAEVDNLLHDISYQKARLKRIETRRRSYSPSVGAMAVSKSIAGAIQNGSKKVEQKIARKLVDAQSNLQELASQFGLSPSAQTWQQARPGSGAWTASGDETPAEISEQIYPLYPLIPREDDEDHTSGHKTMWYGLLPVGSSDVDSASNPQFDDRSSYEVRCFVRRHKPHCPKSNDRNDCCGEIVWSRPTEAYELAPHFDLLGTSNRLTTIQAPDLNALKDQIQSPNFAIGQGMGVAVATPGGSGLPIEMDTDGNPKSGQPSGVPSICFFAIPLITIIALFVLRLFLPIVVFLFGLWFLLSLKLCILPTISIDLGAELDAGLEGDLALGVDLDVSLKAKLDVVLAGLPEGMRDALDDEIQAGGQSEEDAYRSLARMAIDQSMDFSGSGIAPEIIAELAAGPGLPQVEDSQKSTLPDPAERLVYYETKTLTEVFA